MSEASWSKEGILVPPTIHTELPEPIRIEQPEQRETRPAGLPLQTNPALAVAFGQTPDEAAPPDGLQTLLEMGMALYLLQSVHGRDTPATEHLPRPAATDPDDEEPFGIR